MIAQSRTISLAALSIALAVHGIGLDRLLGRVDTQIEGATGSAEASVGNSFADMAAGTMTALETDDMMEPVPVDNMAEDTTPDATPQDPVTQTEPDQPLPDTEQAETPDIAETPPPDTVIAAAEPAPLAPTVPLAPVAPSDTAPQDVAQPIQPETLETLEPVEDNTSAVSRSLRPKPRTSEFEKKHEPEPPKPAAQPKEEQPAQRTAQPKGNTNQNATTGTATGQAQKKPAASGTGSQSATGNAAASNYPGKVMKRISRVPRPRVGSRGTAVVAFQIGSNGGLAGLSLARSSGSAKLDQAALKVIRRAAPFPPPPAGARRSFSIQIKGR